LDVKGHERGISHIFQASCGARTRDRQSKGPSKSIQEDSSIHDRYLVTVIHSFTLFYTKSSPRSNTVRNLAFLRRTSRARIVWFTKLYAVPRFLREYFPFAEMAHVVQKSTRKGTAVGMDRVHYASLHNAPVHEDCPCGFWHSFTARMSCLQFVCASSAHGSTRTFQHGHMA
jgi:hypothetical protein